MAMSGNLKNPKQPSATNPQATTLSPNLDPQPQTLVPRLEIINPKFLNLGVPQEHQESSRIMPYPSVAASSFG